MGLALSPLVCLGLVLLLTHSKRFGLSLLFVFVVGLLLPNESAAEPTHTSDRIIYASDNVLWSIAIDEEKPRALVDKLPWAAKDIARIRVASNGSAMLVEARGYVGWARLTKQDANEKVTLDLLPCSGPAHLSPNGNEVVCATLDKQRIALYTMRPNDARVVAIIDAKPQGPLFLTPQSEVIAFDEGNGLVALRPDGSRRPVSPHRPDASMTVSADGKRAVGGYREDSIDVVYSFRLDGKAVKRTLMQAARTLDTSADSKWVAMQQEVDACAVRMAGGQYMCWRRFEVLGVSKNGRSILLTRASKSKGHNLYVGAVEGTSSRKPKLLLEGVTRAAAFWPDAAR
jgi:hypothetical protein